MEQIPYIIVGSGVAGLTLAIKLSEQFPERQICMVTKSSKEESNTKYAQGGIAVVMNHLEDSYEKHIEDTLICGDGLCNPRVVEMVVKDGPTRVRELMEWGAQFDINFQGQLDLGREGGHSKNRVVHHKDQTGFEIERTILEQAKSRKNIEILEYHCAVDLIVEDSRCIGVIVFNEHTSDVEVLYAQNTILATGGIGQVYGHTTNPSIATGDGIAMAHRAGAVLKDMEFIQFHPTALYNPGGGTTFLISEAVRGFGAYLRTKKGERFMLHYDARGDLASRDIVSQSIEKELKKSGDDCVYIDATHLNSEAFKKHFPMIYEQCGKLGITIEKDWIPVAPSQHYLCGGIAVDVNGKSSIANLYACGECSYTGLHGANRLASNSLLEALVYSHRIYLDLCTQKLDKLPHNLHYSLVSNAQKTKTMEEVYLQNLKLKMQRIVMQSAGIIRNNTTLLQAKLQLEQWLAEMSSLEQEYQISKTALELKNCITVALLILDFSIGRNENKGAFIKQKE